MTIITARCTIVQSVVLRLHVICLSVRPSVCTSVTLMDHNHIGWKSWKLIARTISPTPSLFEAQRPSTYSQGNIGKLWGDYRWGGKNRVLEHKSSNISANFQSWGRGGRRGRGYGTVRKSVGDFL